MIKIIDVAAARARMVIAFIILSLLAGGFAYYALPKEGEPDIEILPRYFSRRLGNSVGPADGIAVARS
jgi:hypothetical protein